MNFLNRKFPGFLCRKLFHKLEITLLRIWYFSQYDSSPSRSLYATLFFEKYAKFWSRWLQLLAIWFGGLKWWRIEKHQEKSTQRKSFLGTRLDFLQGCTIFYCTLLYQSLPPRCYIFYPLGICSCTDFAGFSCFQSVQLLLKNIR